MRILSCFIFSAAMLLAQKVSGQTLQHGVTLNWVDTANPTGTTYDVYRLAGTCPPVAPTTTTGATHLNSTPITVKTYFDSTTVAGQTYCYFGTAGTGVNVSAVSNDASGAPLNTSFPMQTFTATSN